MIETFTQDQNGGSWLEPSTLTTNITYPHWLESWWMELACQQSKQQDPHEMLRSFETEVRQLSDTFTTERKEGFDAYQQQTSMLLAYGLFYFPQTFARVRYPLLELLAHRKWSPPLERPLRILDLGAGLGAASISFAHLFASHPTLQEIEITALDSSRQSLQYFRKLTKEQSAQWPNVSWDIRNADLRKTESWLPTSSPHWDLIIASFSLNEAFYGALDEQIKWTELVLTRALQKTGVFLILDPASQEKTHRFEQYRDHFADHARYHVWSPCLHEHPCPLRQEGKRQCHEVRQWEPPDSMTFLNRRLFRHITSLKYSFLALGKQPAPAFSQPEGQALFRMIAPLQNNKAHAQMTGCCTDGCKREFEWLKRCLDKPTQKQLVQLERGDIVHVTSLQEMSRDGYVRLQKDSSCTVVHPTPLVLKGKNADSAQSPDDAS
tara:strand:- start:4330 stop:5637 length:1308 start_codon:yes stop_codon:yes gene_type:complete